MATNMPLFSHLATSAARADCLSNPWSNTKMFKFQLLRQLVKAGLIRFKCFSIVSCSMNRTSLRFSCRWAHSAIAWARASAQHPPHPHHHQHHRTTTIATTCYPSYCRDWTPNVLPSHVAINALLHFDGQDHTDAGWVGQKAKLV